MSSKYWLILTVAFIIITFILSGISDFSFVVKRIQLIFIIPSWIDLIVHAVEYAILAWLYLNYHCSKNCTESWTLTAFKTILLCGTIGGLNEFLQAFIPNRFPSLLDEIANLFGAVIVIGLFILKSKLIFRRQNGTWS